MPKPRIEIHTQVVDHFGDAGVCLRLARGLAQRGADVQLVIDRPSLVHEMWRSQSGGGEERGLGRLEVCASTTCLDAPDLMIEAFHHTAPLGDRLRCERMTLRGKRPRRVLLDYLATQSWVDSMQGLSAPDREVVLVPEGRTCGVAQGRIWMAPSFSLEGPGLVVGAWREADEAARLEMRQRLLRDCARWGTGRDSPFLVMGFGYEDVPWERWREAVQLHGLPAGFDHLALFKPRGIEMSQDEFDLALQACDFNIVRGEDSFVRAHWAAASRWRVPLVWQPYRQEGGTHADKLMGWLQGILGEPDLSVMREIQLVFNHLLPGETLAPSWQLLCAQWESVRRTLWEVSSRRLRVLPPLEDSLLRLLHG